MITPSRSKNREIIPRWRRTVDMWSMGEADAFRSRESPPWLSERSELDFARTAWQELPSKALAAELVTAALLWDEPTEATEAAEALLASSTSVGERRLANSLIANEQPHEEISRDPTDGSVSHTDSIGELRKLLRRNLRNPLAWTDLSHAYASLGLKRKASRAMRTALDLAPDSRIVLRSASRLFIHLDEPDRAHHIVYRSDRARDDPWLIAAELATAAEAGQSPRYVRRARRLDRSSGISDFHLSEVRSALATLELASGSNRRSRQLFRKSLDNPTDNSVAQAEWASKRGSDVEVPANRLQIASGFEARAWHAATGGDWVSAKAEGEAWARDEPYATTPAIFASYAAAIGLRDFVGGIEIARRGLMANPGDALLRNNLVFSLVNAGDVDEARSEFRRIEPGSNPDVLLELTLLATAGLLSFREGDPQAGRTSYRSAVGQAIQLGDRRAQAIALTLWAHEEVLLQSIHAPTRLAEADRARSLARVPELGAWISEGTATS